MNTTTITFPIDARIKKKAEEKAEKYGIKFLPFFHSIFNSVLQDFVKQDVIGSEIRLRISETPSLSLIKAMKKAKQDIKAGKASPVFENYKDLRNWLKKQGI